MKARFYISFIVEAKFYKKKKKISNDEICSLKNLGPFMLDLSLEPLIFLGIHFKIPLGIGILRILQNLTE